MRRVLSLILCGVLLPCLTIGCGAEKDALAVTDEPALETEADVSEAAPVEISPDLVNNGVFTKLYSSEYKTLNYLKTGSTNELKAAANIIDGLTEYDSYGIVLPALAESWSANADNTVWTFKIRQGVKWVDKNGKEIADVTAQDWVDSAKYVNDARNKSAFQYMYEGIVKNASVYYWQTADLHDAETAVAKGKSENIDAYFQEVNIDTSKFIEFDDVGVKALDTYTLEYTLASPTPCFISMLSYSSYLPVYGPFLEEQDENFGTGNDRLLFNGAYILSEYEPDVKHIFKTNPLYWDKGKIYIPEYHEIYDADTITAAPGMFLRGEVSEAAIGADILDNWFSDPKTSGLVRGSMPIIAYSYFYTFNFEPRFDERYEPDNWMIAVNNENFRQAFMYGLDRVKALSVIDPYNPELLVNNTVTPPTFAVGAGKDLTQYDELKQFSDGNNFDEAKTLEYRDKAKEELTEAGAKFPIKVLMPYNPSVSGWEKESLLVEEQLESLLGSDFIDIIPEEGPHSGFLDTVRRTGCYAFMKCNWGADYADPQTWTEPFAIGNTYNFMYTDEKRALDDIPLINKSGETQSIVSEYYKKEDAAKAHIMDMALRYTDFADAEAFLLRHAIIVPFSVDTYGYIATFCDPFSYMFAPYGLSPYRYKGVKLLEKPMSNSEFVTAYAEWKDDWAKAQASQ